MKKAFYTFLLISPLVFISSCEEDKEEGCTDSQAINYNSGADIDDSTCLYDWTGVWEITSAILNGDPMFPTTQITEAVYYINLESGVIGTQNYNSNGDLTHYGDWNIISNSNNSVVMGGAWYDYSTDEEFAVFPSIAFNVDFMTNNHNMTWRFVDFPNPGDTYVETLVRSTTYSLSDWQ